uniref:Zinc finger, CCHC-type n=1 Tax=Tanacetum cinerariifolium TaxID=118510 RepID=A0A6L2KGT7_TANCI|nr:zinc finger, CCHC-type [Tanacetum cinerariifolium]
MMTGTKFNIDKFDGKNDFALWQVKMKALLEHQGLVAALEELPTATIAAYNNVIRQKAFSTLILCLGDQSYGRSPRRRLQWGFESNLAATYTVTSEGEISSNRYEAGKDSTWSKSQVRSSKLRNEDQVSSSEADAGIILYKIYEITWLILKSMTVVIYCLVMVWNAVYEGQGTLEKEGFTVKMQSGKIKVMKGSLMVLSGTKKANCVYTLDGQAVTRKTLKEVYTTMYEQWVAKHFGVAVIQQQNGLVKETNVTLLAKVRCFLIQSGLSKTPIDILGFFGWLASIKKRMLEPVKVKCIFLGYHKGTGSVQVLQGAEFEVEPHEDHTFEVEPHGNVNHVVGSQEVQTQDLIYYHLTRDREQHLACELFSYREDSNKAAFAVVAVEKIYVHKSLTFNNTVALTTVMAITESLHQIVRDQSGNTLRVSQSRFYSGKSITKYGSMIQGCAGSREAMMLHMMALSTTEAAYMTPTEAVKEAIWLKGLAIESGFVLKIAASIATGALSKASLF